MEERGRDDGGGGVGLGGDEGAIETEISTLVAQGMF